MYVTHLECPKCELTYESEQPMQLCTCGAPLLVSYDLEKVRDSLSRDVLVSRKPTYGVIVNCFPSGKMKVSCRWASP